MDIPTFSYDFPYVSHGFTGPPWPAPARRPRLRRPRMRRAPAGARGDFRCRWFFTKTKRAIEPKKGPGVHLIIGLRFIYIHAHICVCVLVCNVYIYTHRNYIIIIVIIVSSINLIIAIATITIIVVIIIVIIIVSIIIIHLCIHVCLSHFNEGLKSITSRLWWRYDVAAYLSTYHYLSNNACWLALLKGWWRKYVGNPAYKPTPIPTPQPSSTMGDLGEKTHFWVLKKAIPLVNGFVTVGQLMILHDFMVIRYSTSISWQYQV